MIKPARYGSVAFMIEDDGLILDDGETEADAVVSHEVEDRPDPDALAGEEVDDSWLFPAEDDEADENA